ncbi:MAG: CRISPR-associated endoribonuclease Cas6 [Bacteroidales bacterium]|nr:CRISPR-associated endoribonuclease Cas6 [Lachnoclostridium sp.]MCM1383157.1 CRISPR-associated endoribonuclease Cas6 [Lachnoclostridium sp.]MCM1464617.1 CRISPR-associated endoribonuclease Cas6 [Bacteroidales bacterium]
MLAVLRMELNSGETGLGYYQSSNLQGVLMEQLDSGYAEQLHISRLKPYSQYIIGGSRKEWVINTFTQEAYQKIICPLLNEKFSEFIIEKKEMHIKICSKELETLSKQELLNEFYSDTYDRYIRLKFLTPTSFKSGGVYINMPDVRYIYQSLMNKYSAASDDMDMYDEETLEQLTTNSRIVRYNLRSAVFPLEGVKIPSFMGEMDIKILGTPTMAKYVRLLVRFGEYSGVGIKTAIGMGGLRMRREQND